MELQKKVVIAIFCVLALFLLGCKEKQTQEIWEQEINRKPDDGCIIPFTLNCPFAIGRPAFKITISNRKYFFFNKRMLVAFDTGASKTYLYNSGEKKFGAL